VNSRSRWVALIAGMAIALTVSGTVLAYSYQTVVTLTISVPGGSQKCGHAITVHATALDIEGKPIEGQPISWAFTSTPSSKDKVNSTPTNTNASGVATTTVTLGCVVGSRTLTATGDLIRASGVLSVTSGGLPGTSTALVSDTSGQLPIGPLLAILALLAGCGIIVRRLVFDRR
jgi:Bacterial Ig-like domain (group 1)